MLAPGAFRIILLRTTDSLKLDSVMHLRKVVPPSVSRGHSEIQSGVWFDIEDARGRALYRRILGAHSGYREVFTGEEREMKWVEISEVGEPLPLLVPDLSGAEALVVYACGMGTSKTHDLVKALFRVTFAELRTKARKRR